MSVSCHLARFSEEDKCADWKSKNQPALVYSFQKDIWKKEFDSWAQEMRTKVQNIQVFNIDNEIKYSETRETGKGVRSSRNKSRIRAHDVISHSMTRAASAEQRRMPRQGCQTGSHRHPTLVVQVRTWQTDSSIFVSWLCSSLFLAVPSFMGARIALSRESWIVSIGFTYWMLSLPTSNPSRCVSNACRLLQNNADDESISF